MPRLVIAGAVFMSIALILYSIGIITLLVKGKVRRFNVIDLACASLCDITGTVCMIVYSGGNFLPADWHGWVGYAALLLMLVNLVLVFYNLSKDKLAVKMRVFDICIYVLWLFSYSLGFIKL